MFLGERGTLDKFRRNAGGGSIGAPILICPVSATALVTPDGTVCCTN
jgi:hypothetical protein